MAKSRDSGPDETSGTKAEPPPIAGQGPSTGSTTDLGDDDPWRLPSTAQDSTPALETGTTPPFARTRARPTNVSGSAELIIPDCIVRLERGATSGAVSGVIESKPSEASAKGSRGGKLEPPPGVRPRVHSQPAIMVEDHELEEVLEEESPVSDRDAIAPNSAPPPHPTGSESGAAPAWHDLLFEQGEGPIVSSGGDEEAHRDIEFILQCTGLTKEQTVLDVACGAGRHCFALTDRGIPVLGLDRSPHQLGIAKARNAKRVRKAKFVSGDMRSLDLNTTYDLVTCLGSSFGYFSEEENLRCLEQIRNCVKPGGAFVLQTFNRDFVVSKVPCRSWWSDAGYLVLDEVDYDYVSEKLRVKRTMLGEDGVQTEHHIQIRSYGLRELCLLLATAGLQVVELSGSRGTRGYFYGCDSPELWLVARRPA